MARLMSPEERVRVKNEVLEWLRAHPDWNWSTEITVDEYRDVVRSVLNTLWREGKVEKRTNDPGPFGEKNRWKIVEGS
jgi:hypothetical protein